jgi:FixJ family two-component response regulator
MMFPSRFTAYYARRWRCPFGGERKTTVSNPPVISIVDDDESVRLARDNLLKSLGYIVHTFASAQEFLRSPHSRDTSCVIADVQMPGMSGVELQAILLDRDQRVPFIFITAFPDMAVRTRALKAGAVGFLTKPFDGATLIKCLETALARHGGSASE